MHRNELVEVRIFILSSSSSRHYICWQLEYDIFVFFLFVWLCVYVERSFAYVIAQIATNSQLFN